MEKTTLEEQIIVWKAEEGYIDIVEEETPYTKEGVENFIKLLKVCDAHPEHRNHILSSSLNL